jgi:hypothetical protein
MAGCMGKDDKPIGIGNEGGYTDFAEVIAIDANDSFLISFQPVGGDKNGTGAFQAEAMSSGNFRMLGTVGTGPAVQHAGIGQKGTSLPGANAADDASRDLGRKKGRRSRLPHVEFDGN